MPELFDAFAEPDRAFRCLSIALLRGSIARLRLPEQRHRSAYLCISVAFPLFALPFNYTALQIESKQSVPLPLLIYACRSQATLCLCISTQFIAITLHTSQSFSLHIEAIAAPCVANPRFAVARLLNASPCSAIATPYVTCLSLCNAGGGYSMPSQVNSKRRLRGTSHGNSFAFSKHHGASPCLSAYATRYCHQSECRPHRTGHI